MTQSDHQFRVVLRGYDPAEVDRAIGDLTGRVQAAEQAATKLHERVQQAEAAINAATENAVPAQPATFAHLGERVGQILLLAEEEATELRETSRSEMEAVRKDAEQAAVSVRDAADQYAETRRRDADAEGTQLLTDARRAADQERDAA